MSAVTTGGALSWLANAPLSLLRRGLAASAQRRIADVSLNSLRRSAGLAGNALKAQAVRRLLSFAAECLVFATLSAW
jgi:hypothetical protein